MPERALHVELLAHTPDPEKWIATASRTCYSAKDLDQLQELADRRDNAAYIKGVLESGHTSVIEHAAFTFGIEGVSRTLLAQITRHRVASFSVQSQRYVAAQGEFDYVLPPRVAALGEEARARFAAQMAQMQAWYDGWAQQLGQENIEDARFVLPGAAATRMVITMNARELLHFFSLRCCNRAQWEIRALANRMLALVRPIAPAIFGNAGPACLRGPCPEGSRSCGQAQRVRAMWEDKA